jgi:alpha-1,3-glucan synthase
MNVLFVLFLVLTRYLVSSLKFDVQEVGYNLNENTTTLNPLEYWGEWPDHQYHASPSNWRFPFYTMFLDRFVNGDPSNDDANATVFEHDALSNQFRHGGDIAGLVDALDYIQGMGIKVSRPKYKRHVRMLNTLKGLYIAGSPFVNLPWKADGYSVCQPVQIVDKANNSTSL